MSNNYKPGCGTTINRACEEACEIAKDTGGEVSFNFNGITLAATPETVADGLANEYIRESNARWMAYQESEEGKRAAEQRAAEIAEKNSRVNALVIALPEILKNGNMGNLMDWLEAFTPPANDVDVELDHTYLAGLLEGAGYTPNEGCGNGPEWFNTQERVGRNIIGQALAGLQMGFPPHGITMSEVKMWRELGEGAK